MSMAGFQRAYAGLAASPRLCLAVRANPAEALAGFDLDARELDRLTRAVWQRGMDANCTLYRTTRVAALDAVIPLTLDLLRPALRPLLDEYWEAHPVHEVRFARETARFIAWLDTRPATLPEPAAEIVAFARRELAVAEAGLSEA